MENKIANHGPGHKTRDKKQTAIIILVCVAAAAVIGLCVWFFGLKDYLAASKADPVYVSSVASIAGASTEITPKFSGLVEPQQITKINKDDSRTVSEIIVSEGDTVNVGDVLFIYDTEEMQLSIRQTELDLEGITNQISTLQDQIKTLQAEKNKASKDDQYNYTVQIQAAEYQVTVEEYNRSVKQSELEKLRNSLDNAQVYAEVAGVVREVNPTPGTDSMGQPLPFISILSSGEYLVKGTITELNVNSIYEGQSVVVRSRIDPDAYWQGVVQSVNLSETVQDSSYMSWGMDSGEKSSKYNFYVALNNLNGLILGQHVYIEPDYGASSQRTGLWLPADYVVSDAGGSYVWAVDEDEKLERRTVMLGEYDQGDAMYEIKDGLKTSDYIAYPKDDLVVGGPTTTDASAQVFPDDGDEMLDPGFGGEVDPDMGVNPGIMARDGDEGGDAGVESDGADDSLNDGQDGDIWPEDGSEDLAR